ncbi:biotin biosynthesis protein BioC [Bacillus coahuilensis m2-6]|uniref:biotin transporter BioY n=1 Tax=Bacillus coahuilensis TaxID=408580 RepID=UPI0007500B2B|nr:biotin transporter BioY [Bacillus coahuilensis]KUP05012.1 biotin biosynthesis protein BioC [Bacillus coahuilensis m2-6]
MKLRPIDLTYGALFVAFMAIGANIKAIAPFLQFNGIPITLQTFFAVLAGVVLGKKLGSFSMVVYMLVGFVGAPVFADFTGGPSALLKSSFGFIISYIFAAYIAGWIAEKSQHVAAFITAAFAGTIVNYAFGTTWMYFAFKFWLEAPEGFSYGMAWLWMVPFMPKDAILAVFAGVVGQLLFVRVIQRSAYYHERKIAS